MSFKVSSSSNNSMILWIFSDLRGPSIKPPLQGCRREDLHSNHNVECYQSAFFASLHLFPIVKADANIITTLSRDLVSYWLLAMFSGHNRSFTFIRTSINYVLLKTSLRSKNAKQIGPCSYRLLTFLHPYACVQDRGKIFCAKAEKQDV